MRKRLKDLACTTGVLFCGFVVASLSGNVRGAFAADAEGGKAGFVGAQQCASCHQAQVDSLKSTRHGRALEGVKGVSFEKSCETCHGPGGAHAAGGDKTAIKNPGKEGAEKGSETCLSCHAGEKTRMFWSGSAHDSKEAGCVSCHKVHGGNSGLLAKKNEFETCGECHRDVRALMLKRSKHPVRDSLSKDGKGVMACSSCHNPHGSQAEKLMIGKSVNDTCYSCHSEKKAPLLWEHGPVKEDCLICHAPHGSSNDKLLVTKVPRLCQQCHMQGRHQSGTLGTNSVYANGKGCVNCHAMIHGSNHPSGTVLQR
ncbi:MAG: DmsE family decaheme c-type cytochrome [Elusimicrobia bacterium]|nr:DmsE family decaheme c-type cytochrome [Elusimicrobiota bacterium]